MHGVTIKISLSIITIGKKSNYLKTHLEHVFPFETHIYRRYRVCADNLKQYTQFLSLNNWI